MLSVIIPNYCHARYLKERIESILAQSYQDFELIILDDCSTDNSREVIEQYRSNPCVKHIVYNEQNSGSPFVQWQRGFTLASGEYIWIAESDDVAEPTLAERCIEALESNPNAVLAFTDCRYIDSDSQPLGTTRHSKELAHGKKGTHRYSSKEFIQKRLLYQNYVMNASMAIFRKSAIPADNYYASFRYAGDWLFWIGVAMAGDVLYINEPLDLFRQHKSSTTAQSVTAGRNFDEVRKLLDYTLPQVSLPWGYKLFLEGKYFARVERQRRHNDAFEEGYQRWIAWSRHPRLALIWYRIAKMLNIYRL